MSVTWKNSKGIILFLRILVSWFSTCVSYLLSCYLFVSYLVSFFHFLPIIIIFTFKKILFIYFQGKWREGREKDRERSNTVWLPLACMCPGTCPNWEVNRWTFGLQAGTQSTEPHQPGPYFVSNILSFKKLIKCCIQYGVSKLLKMNLVSRWFNSISLYYL